MAYFVFNPDGVFLYSSLAPVSAVEEGNVVKEGSTALLMERVMLDAEGNVVRYALTEDEAVGAELVSAQALAKSLLSVRVMRSLAQTESFSVSEFATLAKAKQFPEWTVGETYATEQRVTHEGVLYEVVQQVTAQEHQPPSAEGMLAVYRPLSSVGSYGMDGTAGKPFEFLYGMDVHSGEYYTCDGRLWKAVDDMLPCTWYPGQEGVHQWENITE